jgi:type II secretory pathway component PulF
MGHRLASIYRSLAHLHAAAIPWPTAVEKATAGDARFVPVVESLRNGDPLTRAFDGAIPPIDIAALRAGEVSGNLEKTLLDLSTRRDAEAARDRERKAATAYPILLIHFAAVLMPIPDLVMGNVGAAIGWAAIALVPLYSWIFYRAAALRAIEGTASGARPPLWTRILWTRAAVEEADARTLRALGWLEDAGVPRLEAIPLAAHAGAGGRAAEDLVGGYAAVLAGRPLSTAWASIPSDIAAPLSTGEETGRLAEACAHEASALDGTASLRRARAAALVKPLAIILIGIIVGARVFSFYYGMYAPFMK